MGHVSVCGMCNAECYSINCCGSLLVQYLEGESLSHVCVVLQFQLLPSALFKSSSDFIPLGKNLISGHSEHHIYVQTEQDLGVSSVWCVP